MYQPMRMQYFSDVDVVETVSFLSMFETFEELVVQVHLLSTSSCSPTKTIPNISTFEEYLEVVYPEPDIQPVKMTQVFDLLTKIL